MASSKLVLTSHLGIRRRLVLGCFQVVNYGALTDKFFHEVEEICRNNKEN